MHKLISSLILLAMAAPLAYSQVGPGSAAPAALPPATAIESVPPSPLATPSASGFVDVSELPEPAPIEPPADLMLPGAAAPGGAAPAAAEIGAPGETTTTTESPGSTRSFDFLEEDLPQVLRLLARQSKINLYVSDVVVGTLTLRVENKTPLETLTFITQAKGLVLDKINGDYFVKTQAEKQAEPTESGSYTFSYAQAAAMKDLLQTQLASGVPVQIDPRTNTVFYREVRSNIDNIGLFLESVDKPTKQVMIEARLVEVTANPKQSYGINWAGVVGGADTAKQVKFGGSPFPDPETGEYVFEADANGSFGLNDFLGYGTSQPNSVSPNDAFNFGSLLAGQFAILSLPQFSATLRLLNEDSDAEFLANPKVVTADNQEATIKITRNQPVPQLNFNEQTATAVFGGFEDVEFGNTLTVKPSINKDDYITLSVKPEVSNKVRDETFVFAGAAVRAPVIDKRTLESNVLIRSGNTLAIGGLLQDETARARTKVPVLGDIPVLGYLFQEKLNGRSKRNLLVFVTPTIIGENGTGLEDQVNGLQNSGEEYADPNGWRNNARGAFRLTPTSNRQNVASYPKPGTPLAPHAIQYKDSVPSRE